MPPLYAVSLSSTCHFHDSFAVVQVVVVILLLVDMVMTVALGRNDVYSAV